MDVLARKRALRALLRLKLQDMPESDIASQSLRIFHRLSKLACYQSAESVGLFISMKAEAQTSPIIDDCFSRGRTIYVPKVVGPQDMVFLKVYGRDDFASFPITRWGFPEPELQVAKKWTVQEQLRQQQQEQQQQPQLSTRVPQDHTSLPAQSEMELKTSNELVDREELLKQLETKDPNALSTRFILIPGLGFDSTGRRIGRGKGYYDRFLRRLTESRRALGLEPPILVAVAFSNQVLDRQSEEPESSEAVPLSNSNNAEITTIVADADPTPAAEKERSVPVEEHDWRVDIIVTPDTTYLCSDLGKRLEGNLELAAAAVSTTE